MLITKLRKPLALVLVFLMFFSMVPFGYAAEMPSSQFESGVDPPTEESLPEDESPLTEATITSSESDPDSVPEDTIPEAESTPETESSEPSAEDVPQDGPGIMGLSPGDSSTWAIGSTQSSIMLFDFADNGNYTTVLNSQVACAYKPNGTGTTRTAYIKNLGWHFARYNLYPGLQYRLTETKAPDGYNLLDGTAFEGELSADNMNVSLRVVNTRTYTLPKTGSTGLRIFPVFALIPAFACSSGLVLSILRKRRS